MSQHELISEAVRRVGGTQTALAEALGVSQPAVHDWLSGRRTVTVTTAFAIERITGVPVATQMYPGALADAISVMLIAIRRRHGAEIRGQGAITAELADSGIGELAVEGDGADARLSVDSIERHCRALARSAADAADLLLRDGATTR